jgi:hypothetical protein
MKKITLIIIGITAVIVLFLVWVYLLIYGTPTKVNEFFTDFSFFSGEAVTEITPDPTPVDETPVVVDVVKDKLRQLTTRPVIGFYEFQATTTEPKFIHYAEAGTGHIYQINLVSGEEIRLSNTTVPNAETAVFSPDGNYVAIRSGYGISSEVVLITLIPGGSGEAEPLTPIMTDFTFSFENELLYTEQSGIGTLGKAMSLKTKVSRTQFTIPFQQVTMVWSHDATTPHYVYPKATAKLNGYLYAIVNGTIVRQPIDGLGLTAKASADYIFYTEVPGAEPISYFYEITTRKLSSSPILLEPSKCDFSPRSKSTLYCGHELTTYSYNFPDDWYRGTRSFSDRIWLIDLKSQSASQIVSPPQVAGRDIDIIKMRVASDAKMLYFVNKNDNTLWLYEI